MIITTKGSLGAMRFEMSVQETAHPYFLVSGEWIFIGSLQCSLETT